MGLPTSVFLFVLVLSCSIRCTTGDASLYWACEGLMYTACIDPCYEQSCESFLRGEVSSGCGEPAVCVEGCSCPSDDYAFKIEPSPYYGAGCVSKDRCGCLSPADEYLNVGYMYKYVDDAGESLVCTCGSDHNLLGNCVVDEAPECPVVNGCRHNCLKPIRPENRGDPTCFRCDCQ